MAELGEFSEGLVYGAEAVQIAKTVDQPFTLGHAYFGAGDVQLVLPWVASSLGYVYALSGRLPEALPLLEQAVEQSAIMQQLAYYPLWTAHLSEAYLLSGRQDDACQRAEQALALSRDYKQRGHEAHALRLLGEIAAHGVPPEVEQAEAFYRQALALADELGMRPLLAHCHYGLGILYNRVGRPEQARTELSAAIELYRAMEMTFWLARAEATPT